MEQLVLRVIQNAGFRVSLFVITVVASGSAAIAVPSFTEQTGQRCGVCHVGGLGPQLTPFGRKFKLEGYVMRAGDKFTLPIAGIVVDSFVKTQKDQPSPPAPH